MVWHGSALGHALAPRTMWALIHTAYWKASGQCNPLTQTWASSGRGLVGINKITP